MTRNSTLEYQAAAFTIAWGVWLLIGNDTSLDAVAFNYLRQTWESAFPSVPARISIGFSSVLIGLMYAGAVFINGAGMSWTPLVRVGCCASNAAFFASFAWSIAVADPWSTGVLTYSVLSIYFTWLFRLNLPRAEHAVEILWGRRPWKH